MSTTPKFELTPTSIGEAASRHGLSRRTLLRGLGLAGVPAVAASLTGCGGANAAEVDTPASPTVTPAPANPAPAATPAPAVTITTVPYQVAMVHKLASARFDITEAIDSLVAYMREAKAGGAALVVAGELYLPGYDMGLNYTSDWTARMWPTIKVNSITVGDRNWQRLLDAARTIGIAVSFGFSEKAEPYYYMSQALIGNDGTVWSKRRKVRPSGSERNYWSDDVMTGNLPVVTTPLGRYSMLMCWDHLRPQSTFNVMAQLPNVHVCAWPYTQATTAVTAGWDRQEVAQTAAAYFSQVSGAVTLLTSVGYCAVYRSSVKVAEITPSDTANLLFYTITPGRWTGSSGSATSEFSYGVLQLVNDSYPGPKVADPEHGTLKLNPQI